MVVTYILLEINYVFTFLGEDYGIIYLYIYIYNKWGGTDIIYY